MGWDEDRRRVASTSKANSPENVKKATYPAGSMDPATSRMSGNFTEDKAKARARLRLRDWRGHDGRLEHLEALIAKGDYTPTGSERIELAMYQQARQRAEDDAETYGGDAA
jgi:hypothetical protein